MRVDIINDKCDSHKSPGQKNSGHRTGFADSHGKRKGGAIQYGYRVHRILFFIPLRSVKQKGTHRMIHRNRETEFSLKHQAGADTEWLYTGRILQIGGEVRESVAEGNAHGLLG